MSVATKMTAIADKIRSLLGLTGPMGLDAMTTNLNEVINEVDVQNNLINQIIAVLENKNGNMNIPIYTLEGDGQEYYTMAPSVLTFRSTAPLDDFQEVQINGYTVDPSSYTLKEGSTIIKFNIDYLKTLNTGNYNVDVVSNSQVASGSFTVVAPKLNKHGFYYNQPYYGGWIELGDVFSGTLAFIVREDDTAAIVNFDAQALNDDIVLTNNNGEYTIEYGNYKFTGRFSTDGNTFVGTEAFAPGGGWAPDYIGPGVDFVLDSMVLCADEDYLYLDATYTEGDNDYYRVLLHNKTKALAGPIKSNINNKPVKFICQSGFSFSDITELPVIPEIITEIPGFAFYNCVNLVEAIIPEHITHIKNRAFEYCSNLINVTIPSGIQYLESSLFVGCSKLTKLTFTGTRAQWNAIEKDNYWNDGWSGIIQCSDGQVAL